MVSLLGNRYINHIDDDSYINRLLVKTGKLELEEIRQYNRVYRVSMEEIKNMIIEEDKNQLGLIEYLGISIGENRND